MKNLDSVLKSRAITLPTRVHIVKAMVFPVVMFGCESWTIKKSEHQRIDAFELWCWRRLLRVPWTARRSKQLIVKEINPEYSFGGLMLKLKLQCFRHLIWRADSLEKIEGRRRRVWQRMRWLGGITDSLTWVWANCGRQCRTREPGVPYSTESQSGTRLDNWIASMCLLTVLTVFLGMHFLDPLFCSVNLLWLLLSYTTFNGCILYACP